MNSGDYILLSILWVGYCVLHSAIISTTFTGFVRKILGERSRYHRIFFNLFSVITIIPLLTYSHSFRWRVEPIFAWEGTLRIVQYALIGLAVILIMAVGKRYSMSRFLGIEQIRGKSGKGMTESGGLDSSGVLGVIRHPWYAAVFILLWTGDLAPSDIIINGILSGYLVIGTILEERKLVLEFGERYRRYQSEVSMFVPLKWVKTRHPKRRSTFISTERKNNYESSYPLVAK